MVTPVQAKQAQSFLGRAYQGALEGIGNLVPAQVREGFDVGVALMSPQKRHETVSESGEKLLSSISNYSILSPQFKKELREQENITLTGTPQKFLGAYAARLLTDVGSDSTRHLYWRYNHPQAIADKILEEAAGQHYKDLGPTQKALAGLAVGAPVAASLGMYDLTNPGELFRPKGFAQSYAEPGSEDRRETDQPGLELVERIFLGRQGRPLKYETAKQDIPELTPERYGRYMKSYYQDKGVTGLGLVKGTMENLKGEPEARIIGFPVGLQAVGALAGGAVALRGALNANPPTRRTQLAGESGAVKVSRNPGATRKAAAITLAGSLAGAFTGSLANQAIAAINNNPEKLPSTYEYQ